MDNLDDELTLATASMCERDVQVNCDMHGVKTVVLPKVFKWFAKDFGDDKLASLTFIAHHLEQAQGVSPAGRDLARELRAILQSGTALQHANNDAPFLRCPATVFCDCVRVKCNIGHPRFRQEYLDEGEGRRSDRDGVQETERPQAAMVFASNFPTLTGESERTDARRRCVFRDGQMCVVWTDRGRKQ